MPQRPLLLPVLSVFTLVLFANPAMAQAQKPIKAEPEVEIRYNKRTTIIYGETAVTGKVVMPQSMRIQSRPRVKFAPRLPIRTSFRRELLNSSSNL